MKKIARGLSILLILSVSVSVHAQKRKVQAAWRSLSDYEESVKEGRPGQDFLIKAKENIDLAAAHESTRKNTRALTYKFRIYYALYRQQLNAESERLKDSIGDEKERLVAAYGSAPLDNFTTANHTLDTIRKYDPAYLEKITEGLAKNNAGLEEEDISFALAVQQLRLESGNIATGKYRAKNYETAADYFYKTAVLNSVLLKSKDTTNFYNACVAASRSKDPEKIRFYNKAMIDAGLATPYNYESLYNAQIVRGDSAAAISSLKRGREMFPADVTLLTQETNLFLATNKQEEALNNLKISSEKDPENALYYFVMGNIYDNMANPKDKASGAELEKPANFDELFANAEKNYLKAIELNPGQEYLYNSLYNLGAMYNNYGGYIGARTAANTKQQKEIDANAQVYYKKAIPNLERALNLRPGDKPTMAALRKLYLLTKNQAKAKEMSDKLKEAE